MLTEFQARSDFKFQSILLLPSSPSVRECIGVCVSAVGLMGGLWVDVSDDTFLSFFPLWMCFYLYLKWLNKTC